MNQFVNIVLPLLRPTGFCSVLFLMFFLVPLAHTSPARLCKSRHDIWPVQGIRIVKSGCSCRQHFLATFRVSLATLMSRWPGAAEAITAFEGQLRQGRWRLKNTLGLLPEDGEGQGQETTQARDRRHQQGGARRVSEAEGRHHQTHGRAQVPGRVWQTM